MILRTTIIFILFFTVSSLFAQSYLGKQHSFSLETQEMMKVFSGDGDIKKASAYYFKMNYPQALKAIKAKGINPFVEEGTIYVDGKKFRFDSRDEGQKISMIMDLESNKMYQIQWAKKEYMEIDIKKMKKMREKVQGQMADRMKGMGSMLQNLPPEARKKIEAMQMGQMLGSQGEEPKVTPTGKSKTINGFSAKEYIVQKPSQMEQIWASTEYSELMTLFEEIESPMGGDKSAKSAIWSEIKGWPVHQVDVEMNMMRGQGSVEYDEVYSIERTSHKAGTFSPPAGFKRTTMEEMMQNSFKGFSPQN